MPRNKNNFVSQTGAPQNQANEIKLATTKKRRSAYGDEARTITKGKRNPATGRRLKTSKTNTCRTNVASELTVDPGEIY